MSEADRMERLEARVLALEKMIRELAGKRGSGEVGKGKPQPAVRIAQPSGAPGSPRTHPRASPLSRFPAVLRAVDRPAGSPCRRGRGPHPGGRVSAPPLLRSWLDFADHALHRRGVERTRGGCCRMAAPAGVFIPPPGPEPDGRDSRVKGNGPGVRPGSQTPSLAGSAL